MEMRVTLPGNQRVEATYKGFRIATDQPIENGGEETAPTPYDLFLASVGSCMGFYAERFCMARNLAVDGLELALSFERDPTGRHLQAIHVAIQLPDEFPARYRPALKAAIGSCAVKKLLEHPPRFEVEYVAEPVSLVTH